MLRSLNVTAIVRLNSPCYDPSPFLDAGMEHFDHIFEDCTATTGPVIAAFLRIADAAAGAITILQGGPGPHGHAHR